MRTPISERATHAGRLRDVLNREAAALGFDDIAVTKPEAIADAAPRLAQAIADGHHGTMAWLAETIERRSDPRILWTDARSAIVLAVNYGPSADPLPLLDEQDRAYISIYARNRDYHDLIKGRLKTLASKLLARVRELDGDGEVKVFVDTAPLMEKPLAAAAGLGWQGKHTNLVSRSHGSWLFLGVILTTLELAADPAETDHCGSCRQCLDICPTDAFPEPYRLDARRCISYLTIEHDGLIPRQFRAAMGNRIYGCDDCLAVCPWNKFARAATEAKLVERPDLSAPTLAEFLELDDAAFRARFSGSPVKRIGRDRFVRNVLVAAGNSADAKLIPAVERLMGDPSPQVRGMAIWALSRLDEAVLRRHLPRQAEETESEVQAEWRMASETLQVADGR